MKVSNITLITMALAATLLASCAKVGSERWCENMKDTSKTEWSIEDAANFAKHCVKF